ncbi:hypothetical protein [Brevundimonas sp.]|uniref:hypothetical protein n=1 Tax=Brevundimonas sp. TaxID=1871086 RepID=UPI002897EDB0|nr:hypothetical protein [Brevundimonas sp.]
MNFIQVTVMSDDILGPYIKHPKPRPDVPDAGLDEPQLVRAQDFSVRRPGKRAYSETTTVWLDLFYMPEQDTDHLIAYQNVQRLIRLIDRRTTEHGVHIEVQGTSEDAMPDSKLHRRRIMLELEQR